MIHKRFAILVSAIVIVGLNFGMAQNITVYEVMHLAKVMPIPITTPWTSTGVTIATGDTVNIKCDGIATTNSNLSVYWCGPEGIYTAPPSLPVVNCPAYSLIGRIGSGGTPFYVGRVLAFRANVGGTLYLGYNDGIFSDNYGYYVAYIFKSRR